VPFCQSFDIPNSFNVTVLGDGDLAGQQKTSLVTKNGLVWSISDTFPCGANYTLSMTCDANNNRFVYDGAISCCIEATKTIISPTIEPLFVPNAILSNIVFYSNCDCPEECSPVGACCVCTGGWVNSYVGDRAWGTKEEADAWNVVLEGVTATAIQSLESNGYECISSSPPAAPFLDESLDPPMWYNSGLGGSGARGTCCGVVDYEGVPASDGDNDTIYPCIQDDVTRNCVNGVSRAECEECPSQTFHAGQTCADNPCNPPP
jgi:hypothetical protein